MLSQPKIVDFGAWTPDVSALQGGSGVFVARNCLPAANGYGPMPQYNSVSTALTAYPRGAQQVRDDTDTVLQYAGDATKLYRNVSDTWTDSSKVGGYSNGTEDQWEFAPWYNTIIATNWADSPQTLTLGGTTFADLTTALRFKHIAVVRDFVVAGYTWDATDGNVPWRVRWCAFQDPTDWTVSASTQADYNDMTQRKIQRVFGGEYGVVFQDESITRMTYVGAPIVFQFDEVVPGLGLLAPGGAVRVNDVIYFLSPKGFYKLTAGSRLEAIGSNRIDETVLADLDRSYLYRVSAIGDPLNHRVFFGYPGAGSSNGQPNKILCYDFARDRWTEITQVHELLWEASSAGVTLEGLDSLYSDVDSIPVSLDDTLFVGGQRSVAMFDSSYKHGFFSGSPMEATIETSEVMLDPSHRSRVNKFRPLIEGTNVTVTARIGSRNDLLDDVEYTESLSPRTGGIFPCRRNARFQRLELTISGEWTRALGVLVPQEAVAAGGRRG